MPKKVAPEDLKTQLTIRIKKKNIEKLKKHENYNDKLDKLIEKHM